MRRLGLVFPFLFLLALLADGPGVFGAAENGPVGASADSPRLAAVSASEAYAQVAAFYQLGPKPAATPQAAAAAQVIADALHAVGVTNVLLNVFDSPTPVGTRQFCNVLATIPAAAPAPDSPPLLLLGAHYDTKVGIADDFAGANDSASGVGALLELARVLAAHPLRHEVRMAFFDGEEAAIEYGPNDGFHGSMHLAAQMHAAQEVPRLSAMILLDMVGDASLSLTLPANTDVTLRRLALDAATAQGCRPAIRLVPYTMGDDHVAFQRLGVPAIDFIDFEYGSAPRLNDYWHTSADTLDKLSADSLGTVIGLVLRLAEELDAQLPPAAAETADSAPDSAPLLATWLFTLALLLLLLGLIGCVLPALPGPPLAYAALLVLQLHPSRPYSTSFLVFAAVLTLIVTLVDIFAPSWLTKQFGGSRLATWGSLIGFLVGLFCFPPFGFLIGGLGGAFLGELLAGSMAGGHSSPRLPSPSTPPAIPLTTSSRVPVPPSPPPIPAAQAAPAASAFPTAHPFRAALAAFGGFLLGTGFKLLLCLYFIYEACLFWR